MFTHTPKQRLRRFRSRPKVARLTMLAQVVRNKNTDFEHDVANDVREGRGGLKTHFSGPPKSPPVSAPPPRLAKSVPFSEYERPPNPPTCRPYTGRNTTPGRERGHPPSRKPPTQRAANATSPLYFCNEKVTLDGMWLRARNSLPSGHRHDLEGALVHACVCPRPAPSAQGPKEKRSTSLALPHR